MSALSDALNDFKNWAGKAYSFVQQNPTPAGYAAKQVTPVVQNFVQSVNQAWTAPKQLPSYKPMPAVDAFVSWAQSAIPVVQQHVASTPILPFVPQTTLPNLGKASQFVGQQLQRVNIPTLNVPQSVKAGIPITQLPEQVNAFAQSYGRTLSEPQKHPFETALNVLPFMGFAKTKGIQQALRDRLALSKTPEEAAIIYNEFADKVMKTGGKTDLQALRAAFNKELTTLVGGSGNYKTDYAIIQNLKNDTQIGGIIRAIENKIVSIDEALTRVPKVAERLPLRPNPTNQVQRLSVSHGLGRDLARQGMTWDQIIRLTPEKGQKILQGRAAFEDFLTQTPVKQKVNLLDYLRTPNRVFEKIGMGDEARMLRNQYDAYTMQLPKEIDKITQWAKRVPGQQSNENIFRWLDGEKNVLLSPEEAKVATEIKSYLTDWANKLKIPPFKRVSDYITHIYSLGTVEQEFDEELAKIIDPMVAKSIYNPFLQHRVGQRIDYLKDTWQALQAYTKRATRKYFMDPVLERVAQKAESLPLESWDYVKAKISNINMRPEKVDTLIDNIVKSSPVGYKLGQRPVASLTRKARSLVFRALLGLNPASALRNLGQTANTYAVLGELIYLSARTYFIRNI